MHDRMPMGEPASIGRNASIASKQTPAYLRMPLFNGDCGMQDRRTDFAANIAQTCQQTRREVETVAFSVHECLGWC